MKKIFILSVFTIFSSILFSQKIAYVSSEYILDKIPEYKSATEQINQLSLKWNEEIEKIYNEVELMYKDYQTKQFLMTKEERIEKEQKILKLEQEAKNLEQKRYGNNGDLFTKRNELVQPIQDKILKAINNFSEENRYDIILDKDGDLILLYTNKRIDVSDEILKKIGY
ncbi:MAG: hypothetical protein CMP58_00495 [Flavobacteriales bacterium]|nr:hypothetical protein [Flavobacteriales bacterium]|tara:strand:- start:36 stop:542 length:507 start_codon:yes stop_codon:yes gene_type:complete